MENPNSIDVLDTLDIDEPATKVVTPLADPLDTLNVEEPQTPVNRINKSFERMSPEDKLDYLEVSEDKPVHKKAEIAESYVQDSKLKQATRGFLGLTLSVPQTLGKLKIWFADAMQNSSEYVNKFPKYAELKARRDLKAERWQQEGFKQIEKNQAWLDELQLSKQDGDGLAYDLGAGVASLGQSLTMFAITKNPALASATFGTYSFTDTYLDARNKGKTFKEAQTLGVVAGTLEGALESIGLNKFIKGPVLKKMGRGVLARTFEVAQKFGHGFTTEAIQEGSQTFKDNVIYRYGGIDNERALLDGVARSMLVGGLVGGPVSIAIPSGLREKIKEKNPTVSDPELDSLEHSIKQEIEPVIKPIHDVYNNTELHSQPDLMAEQLEEAGLTKEVAEVVAEQLYEQNVLKNIDQKQQALLESQQKKELSKQERQSLKLAKELTDTTAKGKPVKSTDKVLLKRELSEERKQSKQTAKYMRAVFKEKTTGTKRGTLTNISGALKFLERAAADETNLPEITAERKRTADKLISKLSKHSSLSKALKARQVSVTASKVIDEIVNNSKPAEQRNFAESMDLLSNIADTLAADVISQKNKLDGQAQAFETLVNESKKVIEAPNKIKAVFTGKEQGTLNRLFRWARTTQQKFFSELTNLRNQIIFLSGDKTGPLWSKWLEWQGAEIKRLELKHKYTQRIEHILSENKIPDSGTIKDFLGYRASFDEQLNIVLKGYDSQARERLIKSEQLSKDPEVADNIINEMTLDMLDDGSKQKVLEEFQAVYKEIGDLLGDTISDVENRHWRPREYYSPSFGQDERLHVDEFWTDLMRPENQHLVDDFTHERKKNVKAPLDVSSAVGDMFSHIHGISRYVAFAKHAKEANQLVHELNPKIREQFNEHTAKVFKRNVEHLLYGPKYSEGAVNKALDTVRNLTMSAITTLNLKIFANQAAANIHVADIVGEARISATTAQIAGNPNLMKQIIESDPLLYTSVMDYQLGEVLEGLQRDPRNYTHKGREVFKQVVDKARIPTTYFDMIFRTAAYKSAYDMHLEQNPGDTKGAVAFAREVIVDTQVMAQDAFRSPVQYSTGFDRHIFTFMSQTTQIFNYMGQQLMRVRNGKISKARFAASVGRVVVLQAAYITMLQSLLDEVPENKDAPFYVDLLQNILAVTHPFISLVSSHGDFGGKVLTLRFTEGLGKALNKALNGYFTEAAVQLGKSVSVLVVSPTNVKRIKNKVEDSLEFAGDLTSGQNSNTYFKMKDF